MKITIDREKCRGHSNCASIAPNVFELDGSFKSFILDPRGDSDELILKAARACPKLAIVLEDEASGARISPDPTINRAINLISHHNQKTYRSIESTCSSANFAHAGTSSSSDYRSRRRRTDS